MSKPTALASERAPSFERALVLSALLYSACRFVPLPFADEIFRNAVSRLIVSQALDRHGRSFSSKAVAPLYAEQVGCLGGCLTALPKLLAKLILFPIRKLLAWIGAARGITRDLGDGSALRAQRRPLSRPRPLARGRVRSRRSGQADPWRLRTCARRERALDLQTGPLLGGRPLQAGPRGRRAGGRRDVSKALRSGRRSARARTRSRQRRRRADRDTHSPIPRSPARSPASMLRFDQELAKIGLADPAA